MPLLIFCEITEPLKSIFEISKEGIFYRLKSLKFYVTQKEFNEIAKDKAKFDRIKEQNRHQEKYKELWEKVNVDEVVEKFAPNSEPVINDSGKIIFRTPGSNIQVVCEATIGSLCIQDLDITF